MHFVFLFCFLTQIRVFAAKPVTCPALLGVPVGFESYFKTYRKPKLLIPLDLVHRDFNGRVLNLEFGTPPLPNAHGSWRVPRAAVVIHLIEMGGRLTAYFESMKISENLPSEYAHRIFLAHALATRPDVSRIVYNFTDGVDEAALRERLTQGETKRGATKATAPYRAFSDFGFRLIKAKATEVDRKEAYFKGDVSLSMTLER